MKKTYLLMPFLALALASCSNEDDVVAQGADSIMNVKVSLDNPSSRAMVKETSFGSGENIGIFLTAADGGAYDNQITGYSNVKYTSNGTGADQTWTSTTPIKLSATTGSAYAYWPWLDLVPDMTAIALETGTQTDYMYSDETDVQDVSNSDTEANFKMKHALTAIRVNIINDGYSGQGNVERIAVTSDNFATAGSMDITTGVVSYTDGTDGLEVELPVADDAQTAAGAPYTNEYMLVPTGNNGDIIIGVNMDNKIYTNKATLQEAAKKGHIYTINLSAKNNDLSVLSVTIEEWKDGETVSGDMQINGGAE